MRARVRRCLALSPLMLGWQMVVLKDAQMLGALVAAFGIVAHYRFAQGRRMPLPGSRAASRCFLAMRPWFAPTPSLRRVPLLALLLPATRPINCRRGLCAIAAIVVVLASTPLINHRLFGAAPERRRQEPADF